MNYAYLRVSSDKQTAEHQRAMINKRGYNIDKWLVDEATSGTVEWKDRSIAKAIKNSKKGDYIIVAELSRIGRSLRQILEIMERCRKKGVVVVCIREGIELSDDNPITKLLISIMGSLAELERNLISQRTKDALDHKRELGVVLGRPFGRKGKKYCRKLFGKDKLICELRQKGYSYEAMAKYLGVNRNTLDRYRLYMEEEDGIKI